jgi:hypothetical protein
MHTEPTGFQLSLLGQRTAVEHADRVTGGEWSAAAWDFLIHYGRNAKGAAFMTEDVRREAERTQAVPAPTDRRAWGAIINKASKARLIRSIGHRPQSSPNAALPGGEAIRAE